MQPPPNLPLPGLYGAVGCPPTPRHRRETLSLGETCVLSCILCSGPQTVFLLTPSPWGLGHLPGSQPKPGLESTGARGGGRGAGSTLEMQAEAANRAGSEDGGQGRGEGWACTGR